MLAEFHLTKCSKTRNTWLGLVNIRYDKTEQLFSLHAIVCLWINVSLITVKYDIIIFSRMNVISTCYLSATVITDLPCPLSTKLKSEHKPVATYRCVYKYYYIVYQIYKSCIQMILNIHQLFKVEGPAFQKYWLRRSACPLVSRGANSKAQHLACGSPPHVR